MTRRNSNYRLRLKAQSETARAAALAHLVELRQAEEREQLSQALTESGRNFQTQENFRSYLLAGASTPPLMKGRKSHE